ncbi:hypothetical protein, partial [Corallococcus sp. CA049B]|uniref:hypothetical protein n=1 Tax=Corallococcus sp. CA049B TaxID=2316730 RepID=UPI001F424388
PFPWALPPIQAAQARGVAHEAGSHRWWESWTRHFARELEAATATVLHSGRWSLHPLRVVSEENASPNSPPGNGLGYPPASPYALETALRFDPFWVERWSWSNSDASIWPEAKMGAVMALREPSRPDASRVKAWRKHARDGTLPPALLLYMELPEKWLVLDGHDRIHAALLEGTTPPLLGLWPVITHPTRLQYDNPGMRGPPCSITRAWPIRKSDWQASVLRAHPRRPDGVTAEDWDGFVGDRPWARGN